MKNTRTFILILSIIFTGIQLAKAQEKGTNEISIGYGVGSSDQFFDNLVDISVFAVTIGNLTYDNKVFRGPLYVNYNYAIKDQLMIGGTVTYSKITRDVFLSKISLGEQINNIFTIGLESNYRYISNRSFQMYSGLGLGYSVNFSKSRSNSGKKDSRRGQTNSNLNFHLTGIGLRFGKKIAGYFEIGLGYKGVYNLGISHQF